MSNSDPTPAYGTPVVMGREGTPSGRRPSGRLERVQVRPTWLKWLRVAGWVAGSLSALIVTINQLGLFEIRKNWLTRADKEEIYTAFKVQNDRISALEKKTDCVLYYASKGKKGKCE